MVNIVFRSECLHKLFVSVNGFLRDVLSRCFKHRFSVGEVKCFFLFSTLTSQLET